MKINGKYLFITKVYIYVYSMQINKEYAITMVSKNVSKNDCFTSVWDTAILIPITLVLIVIIKNKNCRVSDERRHHCSPSGYQYQGKSIDGYRRESILITVHLMKFLSFCSLRHNEKQSYWTSGYALTLLNGYYTVMKGRGCEWNYTWNNAVTSRILHVIFAKFALVVRLSKIESI